MAIEFDENTMHNPKANDVREWYAEHNTEEDLAYVYNIVHEMWTYHEDATYDYEENTLEYEKALKVFKEWNALQEMLDEEVLSALRKHNVNAEHLDIQTLKKFMGMYGYKESGGWFFKEDDFEADK